MKEIMELSAFLLIIPFFLGVSVLLILYGDFWRKSRTFREGYLIGGIVCIGLAEVTHLISGYSGWSFSRCANMLGKVWIYATLGMLVAGGASLFLRRVLSKKKGNRDKAQVELFTSADFIACVLLAVMLAVVICRVLFSTDVSFYADNTMETAAAFLQTDKMFSVNPFTGNELQMELPSRFRILCLPTIYATLSKTFQIELTVLMLKVIPIWMVLCSVIAFSLLGKAFWPEKRFYRICFLLIVCILFFVTDSCMGQTGYLLFHQGFTAGALRVAVLLPMTLFYLLEKRFVCLWLPIACEGCVCWTFFGTGWCLAFVVVWAVVWMISGLLGRSGGDL